MLSSEANLTLGCRLAELSQVLVRPASQVSGQCLERVCSCVCLVFQCFDHVVQIIPEDHLHVTSHAVAELLL